MNPDPFFAITAPSPEEVVRCAEAIAAHAVDGDIRTSRRKVDARGIRWRNERYLHPLLTGRVGTVVDVAPPSDPHTVDVYADGQWVCTAVRESDLSVEDRKVIFQAVWGGGS